MKKTSTVPTTEREHMTVRLLKPAAFKVRTKMPDAPQQAPAASGKKTAAFFINKYLPLRKRKNINKETIVRKSEITRKPRTARKPNILLL